MSFPFLKNPGHSSLMATLTTVVTVAVLARFLFDGISFTVHGSVYTFSHIDALVYTALLTPVYACQGYVHGVNVKNDKIGEKEI